MKLTNENIESYLISNNFQKKINKLAKKYKNKKIMIYGASIAFGIIKKTCDLSKLNIIGIADVRFDNGNEHLGYQTYNAYSFLEEKPDIVLIAMLNSDIAEYFFEDTLIPKYGDFNYEPMVKLSFFEEIKGYFS